MPDPVILATFHVNQLPEATPASPQAEFLGYGTSNGKDFGYYLLDQGAWRPLTTKDRIDVDADGKADPHPQTPLRYSDPRLHIIGASPAPKDRHEDLNPADCDGGDCVYDVNHDGKTEWNGLKETASYMPSAPASNGKVTRQTLYDIVPTWVAPESAWGRQ